MISGETTARGWATGDRMTAPLVWGGVASLVCGGLTAAGIIALPVGLGAIAACAAVVGLTFANTRRGRVRHNDVASEALAISGDGVWEFDLRKSVVTYDDRCAQMLGYERGYIADRLSAWGKLVHVQDLPRARAALDNHIAGKTDDYEIEVRLKDARGSWCYVLDRGRIVERDAKGKPIRMVGIHRFVTDADAVLDPEDSGAALERVTVDDVCTVGSSSASAPQPTPVAELSPEPAAIPEPLSVEVLEVAVRGVVDELEEELQLLQRAAGDAEERPREPARATALCRRLRRLQGWTRLSIEIVPLAALVDDFAGHHVDIALDLPVVDADAPLLHEALALIVDTVADAPRARRKLLVRGHSAGPGRARVAFLRGAGAIDPEAQRLRVARRLIELMGGSLIVEPGAVSVDLPSRGN